jgi:uncharacterized caspase-like protein
MLALLPAVTVAAEPRIALVIGNGRYASSPLINPPNDAQLIASTLTNLGFEVISRRNSNQTEMKRAIQEFGTRLEAAGPNAVGLFYYAGHGVQLNGGNFLIPVGANIARDSDVEIEAVSADWVMQQMRYARNRLNIVILDACRNNPFARSLRSADRGLAKMDAPAGVMIAYSTAPGDVASDGAGTNSPYSEALAKAMRENNQPIEQVFKRTRIAVMAATSSRQTPWESSSLTGDFYFIGSDKAGAAVSSAAIPVVASAPAASPPASSGRNASAAAAPTATARPALTSTSKPATTTPATATKSGGAASANLVARESAKEERKPVEEAPAPKVTPAPAPAPAPSGWRSVLGVVTNSGKKIASIATPTRSVAAPEPVENFCALPVGEWSMAGNHVKGDVQINTDRTLLLWKKRGLPAVKGTWTCDAANQRYTMSWSYGSVETLAITSANRVMQGTDQHTYRITYKRSR